MAFDATTMILIGQGAGNNVYYYRTNDTATVVDAANYFDGFAAQLRAGDLILVAGDMDGTQSADLFVVSSVSGTTVNVTNGT